MKKVGLLAGLLVFALVASPAAAKKGDLFVAEYDGGEVTRLSPDGSGPGAFSADSDFGALSFLAFAPDGSLFVSDEVEDGSVYRIPRGGGDATDAGGFTDTPGPWGLDRAANGRLLVSDADTTVWQLKPGNPPPTPFAENVGDMWGLDALPNRTTLVADYNNGRILRLSADGDDSVFTEDPDLQFAADVVRAPNGDVYVVTQSGDGHLVRIHDGATEDLASGLGNVYGLALAPNGLIYTTDYSGDAVNLVNPKTGDVTEIASIADGIDGPIGIEVEPPKCKGELATIVGSNKKDKVKGSKFKDVIHTLGGKDRVNAKGGNDIVCGGGGRDKLKGSKGKDKLFGQGGKDKLDGGPGKDKERQ